MYNLDDIVPQNELSTIPIAAVFGGESGEGAILPWSRSEWIKQHLNHLRKQSKADEDKL